MEVCSRNLSTSFSALQRAENSSIRYNAKLDCTQQSGFSALQRAENSSIMRRATTGQQPVWVSVLFSEPKIPQSDANARTAGRASGFQCSSASRKFLNGGNSICGSRARLFQCSSASRKFLNSSPARPVYRRRSRFQCSSASRKFLNQAALFELALDPVFQCSSASRKFLNPDPRTCVHPYSRLRRSRFVVPEPSWCVAMTPVY